jgi:hypothetical protein
MSTRYMDQEERETHDAELDLPLRPRPQALDQVDGETVIVS